VTAPDGRRWRVSSRPARQARWRRPDWDAAHAGADDVVGGGDDLAGIVIGIVLTIFFAVVVGLVVALLAALLLFVVEAIALAVLAYALGRGWVVEAETDGPPAERRAWKVRGWLRSRRVADSAAGALARGDGPSP
jgi:hypothetical protein